MPADDIYKLDVNLEAPSGSASFGMYYEEVVSNDFVGTDTRALAESWDASIGTALINILSDDWKVPSLTVRKMVLNPVEMARLDNVIQSGTVVGPSLAANNAMMLGLKQGTFPSSSDGRLFIPGLAKGATLAGNLTSAFQTGVFLTFANALAAQLVQISAGAGRWNLGVISAKVRDIALPAKDWEGAFAPVTSITANPIIATQRRRQTRVRGRSV